MSDWYHSMTLAQLKGRKVRAKYLMSNGYANLLAGTIFEIIGKMNGLELLSEPCATCGIRVCISKVDAGCVDLLEPL